MSFRPYSFDYTQFRKSLKRMDIVIAKLTAVMDNTDSKEVITKAESLIEQSVQLKELIKRTPRSNFIRL